jgi:hypothetical protein
MNGGCLSSCVTTPQRKAKCVTGSCLMTHYFIQNDREDISISMYIEEVHFNRSFLLMISEHITASDLESIPGQVT